jgi:hypothetical protein
MEVEGIDEVLAAIQKSGAKITMPLKQQFYGMREFAFQDPEGWVVTIAEKVNERPEPKNAPRITRLFALSPRCMFF